MSKLRIGIDINEILRARWLQFDRYYAQEFGEEGVPKQQPYVYNFFKHYLFKDTSETIKELREPEDTPETINPIDYQVNDNTNEAPADFMLFKKSEKIVIPAKTMYNRFMYEDYLFEIHGAAPMMYKNMDVHVNDFYSKYGNSVKFTLFSVENKFSIPPTLFFLSKISSRFKNICFVDKPLEMWEDIDILITTDPEILQIGAPWGKKIIKLNRPYNEHIKVGSLEVLQIADLIGNEQFEKIIKYKNKEK